MVGGPQAVAAPFTKWACAAADVSVLYGMVKRAGELAAQAPAGPVYVNTPVETLLAPWRPSPTDKPAPPPGRTVADPRDVEAAARLIAAAKNPVLATETAGRDPGGVRRPGRAGRAARDPGGGAAVGALLELPADQPAARRAASSPRWRPRPTW